MIETDLFYHEFQRNEMIRRIGDPVFHAVYCALNGQIELLNDPSGLDPTQFDKEIQRDIVRLIGWATTNSDPRRHVLVPPDLQADENAADFKNMVHNALITDQMVDSITFGGRSFKIARVAQEIGLAHDSETYVQSHPGDTDYDKVLKGLETMYLLMHQYEDLIGRGMWNFDIRLKMESEMRKNLFMSLSDMRSYFATLFTSIGYTHRPTHATDVIQYMYDNPTQDHIASAIASGSGIDRSGKDGRAVDDIVAQKRGGRCFQEPKLSPVWGQGSKTPLVYRLDNNPFQDNSRRKYQNLPPHPCFSLGGSRCRLQAECPTFRKGMQQDPAILRSEAESVLGLFQRQLGVFQDRTSTIFVIG